MSGISTDEVNVLNNMQFGFLGKAVHRRWISVMNITGLNYLTGDSCFVDSNHICKDCFMYPVGCHIGSLSR